MPLSVNQKPLKARDNTEQLRLYLKPEEFNALLKIMKNGNVVVIDVECYSNDKHPEYSGRILLGVPQE